MLLTLLVVPLSCARIPEDPHERVARQAPSSASVCKFPLLASGSVDTCNLTVQVEAYQASWLLLLLPPALSGAAMDLRLRAELCVAGGAGQGR